MVSLFFIITTDDLDVGCTFDKYAGEEFVLTECSSSRCEVVSTIGKFSGLSEVLLETSLEECFSEIASLSLLVMSIYSFSFNQISLLSRAMFICSCSSRPVARTSS